ncbi:MAG: hypothetical protein ACPGJV_10945 [Bacteriovoracaceae bacterium]
MFKASIDIGSNSILLLITNVTKTGFEDIVSMSEIAGLGKNVDKEGKLSMDAQKTAFKILKKYKKELKKYDFKPKDVIVTATEAMRATSNSQSFIKEIEKDLGFKIQIVTAETEATLTAQGISYGSSEEEELVILDIGGASTELIKAQTYPFKVDETISLPIGSVRAKDYIDDGVFQENLDKIFKDFDLSPYKTAKIVGVAGTITALAAMTLGTSNFDEKKVNEVVIDFNKLTKFIQCLQDLDDDDFKTQYPFLGKRQETIVAGARVLRAICLQLEIEKMSVSTRGLRYGSVLYDELPLEYLVQ